MIYIQLLIWLGMVILDLVSDAVLLLSSIGILKPRGYTGGLSSFENRNILEEVSGRSIDGYSFERYVAK